MILRDSGFIEAYDGPLSGDMPGTLAMAEEDTLVCVLRYPGGQADDAAVVAWTQPESRGRPPEAIRQRTTARLVAQLQAVAAHVGLSVNAGQLDDADGWPGVLQRNPRCLLIIMSRSDSATMRAFDPPWMVHNFVDFKSENTLRRDEQLIGSGAEDGGEDEDQEPAVQWSARFQPDQTVSEPDESDEEPHHVLSPPSTQYNIASSGAVVGSAQSNYVGGVIGAQIGAVVGSGNMVVGGFNRPPDVPKSARDEPLPHDGLFIRRNNAFGTKSTLGITDLIEQGVLIDQTQIRFDDFIVSRSDGVPLPQADEAVAVSHGYAPAPDVARAYPGTTHFLEVALRAAGQPADGAGHGQPLPVNFVFVVDTSASMTGEKLEIVKESLRQLYDQLRDDDILGVVSFDTNVRTVLRATRKADLSSEDLMSIVYGLRADGGTDLNLGVLYGIDEIGRHSGERSDMVNCLYLFSDGDPTSGETNWIKIRSNIAARLRGDLTISCFGFGADARIRELEALAGSAGGHFTFVNQPEDLKLDLREDLKRREHLAAINIQLQIDIAPEIKIWHLYGHDLVTDPAMRASVIREAGEARRKGKEEFGTEALPDLITQEKGIRIFAPDLAFGETYWIVFEIEVPSGSDPASLGRARLQYVDTIARDNRRHDLTLTPAGAIPDSTVVVHAVGLWTSEITFYALDDLYQDDRATAKERLTRHASVLRSLHELIPTPEFRDDQVTVFKLVSLSENLGRPMAWRDPGLRGGAAAWDYGVYALNKFGQVRAGLNRLSFGP